MEKEIHAQALLLKWLQHSTIRSYEQIRSTSRSLCVSNGINEKHAVLKLLYPLLKRGLVEFIGNGKYQFTPPLLIVYPQKEMTVGINLIANQKDTLQYVGYTEDIFGIIRFPIKGNNMKNICHDIQCEYIKYSQVTPLLHFPEIKEVVTKFERSFPTSAKFQFYNIEAYIWENREKEVGIYRTGTGSMVHHLKIKEEHFKIPLRSQNPEGRILAECYQAGYEKKEMFHYHSANKTLTVCNLQLPILIERALRLASLYKSETFSTNDPFRMTFPDISLYVIKQLNRIFNTTTTILHE